MDTNQNQMGGLSIQNQSDLDSLPGNDPRQRISAVSQVVKIQMFTEIYNAGKQAERGIMVLGITDPNTNHKRVSTKVFIPKDRQDYVLTTLLEVLRSSKISGTRQAAIQSNHSALFTSLSNYKRGGEVDVQTGKQQAILRLLEDMDWSINSIPQKELIEFKEVSRSTYQEWLAETLSTDLTFTPNQAETPGREEKASGKLELIDRLLTVPTYYSNDPDRPAELVMKNTLLQALFPSVSLGQVHFGDDPMLIRNRYNGAEMDIITSGAKRGSVFFSQGPLYRTKF